MNTLFARIILFVRERFNLSNDLVDKLDTIQSIEKGVDFKGINVWTLIFAILIASIGLNVNSTAVIIGAMLISPLMGPIMGLGLSIGIYDFVLMKRSFKNLSIAVILSVLTSTIYFWMSPLSEAESELLARTTPTLYDVLIAFFGGLAGIVAGTTKEKGNAIPGVAIATALMPPLCTAGFGLATGNVYYFLGAFYLFFINAVMISLSTFLIVRFLKFPVKQVVDKLQAARLKRYIYLVVSITVLPSVYLAYQIVEQTIFERNARRFIHEELTYDRTQLLNTKLKFNLKDSSRIEVFVVGKPLEKTEIAKLEQKLTHYSLPKTRLIVRQGIENADKTDINQIKSGIIEEIYHKNERSLQEKDNYIQQLEQELVRYRGTVAIQSLGEEIQALNPKITRVSVSNALVYEVTTSRTDTTMLVYLSASSRLSESEQSTLANWLEKRLSASQIKLIMD